MEMKKSSTSSISFGSGWRAPSGLRLTGRVISTVSAASSRASSSALTCFSLVPNARPKSARSLPMSLPASFFWSFGNAPMALLACVIADSAPAYCVLMAFNSSIVEAFSIFAMPSATASVTAWASNTAPSATRYLSYQPFVLRIKRAIPTFLRLHILST